MIPYPDGVIGPDTRKPRASGDDPKVAVKAIGTVGKPRASGDDPKINPLRHLLRR